MLLPGEQEEDILQQEKIRALLSQVGRPVYPQIVRQAHAGQLWLRNVECQLASNESTATYVADEAVQHAPAADAHRQNARDHRGRAR